MGDCPLHADFGGIANRAKPFQCRKRAERSDYSNAEAFAQREDPNQEKEM
jgi:hypothetical protein